MTEVSPLANQFLEMEMEGVYWVYENTKDFVLINQNKLFVYRFIEKLDKKGALAWLKKSKKYQSSIMTKEEADSIYQTNVKNLLLENIQTPKPKVKVVVKKSKPKKKPKLKE